MALPHKVYFPTFPNSTWKTLPMVLLLLLLDISKNHNCFQRASETSRCLETSPVLFPVLCRDWLRGLSGLVLTKHLPSPKTHILTKKKGIEGVFMREGLKERTVVLVCARVCVWAGACVCVFISSVQMGGRVALAAKWFSMLMSCYLWCCRNNILSFSQWESSLLGTDYTAHTAKVVIYIFTQSSRKYIKAHTYAQIGQ